MNTTNSNRNSLLRAQLRAKRRRLSRCQQHLSSQRLKQKITRTQAWKNAQHIALYLANDGEIDPIALLHACWRTNKTPYLPIVLDNRSLGFYPTAPFCPVKHNRYGIPEPRSNPYQAKNVNQLDLMIIPLVGFDANGNRLGMGGGFYDRTLDARISRNTPLLWGIAHSCQRVCNIQPQTWDVPLHQITTPKQTFPKNYIKRF